MHSVEAEGFVAHFNSDFSGDVLFEEVEWNSGRYIPAALIVKLARRYAETQGWVTPE